MNEPPGNSDKILKNYIKTLEDKIREYEINLNKQISINERVVNNYEYLDQKYDKVYDLLTEEQKGSLED